MDFRLRKQLEEVFGPVNRWFCSTQHGRMIEDANVLLAHFVRSGGAEDFAHRYEQAMSPLNRWYCSEHYCCEVQDKETLWNYYMNHRLPGEENRCQQRKVGNNQDQLKIAS